MLSTLLPKLGLPTLSPPPKSQSWREGELRSSDFHPGRF